MNQKLLQVFWKQISRNSNEDVETYLWKLGPCDPGVGVIGFCGLQLYVIFVNDLESIIIITDLTILTLSDCRPSTCQFW